MSKKQTEKEFIEKAKKIHNNKFDYSKVRYISYSKKVIIICPVHGEFQQTPNNHLHYGCAKCSGRYRCSTEEFIIKAKKIHNNKFDYSKVNFKGVDKKIIIICSVHGEFEQTAKSHLQCKGCPKCNSSYHYTTNEWVQHAQEKLGIFYNYSKVNYINNTTPVIIICPKHGEFEQKPMVHLTGQPCPKCSIRPRYNTETWVQRANEVHDNKYNYSKVKYKNNYTKVTIICNTHGEFTQAPCDHLQGKGCSKCGNVYRYTNKEWIEKAKQIHDNIYTYPNTNYINASTTVLIMCPIHGEFEQVAYSHLNGTGCPLCNKSKGEIKLNRLFKLNNIKTIQEYTYDGLIGKGNGLLRFDFAVFKNQKLIFLLEYQGELHFRPWKKDKKAQEKYKKLKVHDVLKLKYCEVNNIPLEFINYDQDTEERFYYLLNKYKLNQNII